MGWWKKQYVAVRLSFLMRPCFSTLLCEGGREPSLWESRLWEPAAWHVVVSVAGET